MSNLADRIWRRYTSPGLVRGEFSTQRAGRLLGMPRIRRWPRRAEPVELAAPGWEFGFEGAGGIGPKAAAPAPIVQSAVSFEPASAAAVSVPAGAPAAVPITRGIDARPGESVPPTSRARALPLGAPVALPPDAPLSDFRAPALHRKPAAQAPAFENAAEAFPAAAGTEPTAGSVGPPAIPASSYVPAPPVGAGSAAAEAAPLRSRFSAEEEPMRVRRSAVATVTAAASETAPSRSRFSAEEEPMRVRRSADATVTALPLVAPPVAQAPVAVRRTPAEPAPAPAPQAAPEATAERRGEPDIDRLADRVYEILARRLASERARRGL